MLQPNLSAAARFLDALGGEPDSAHTFQLYPEGIPDEQDGKIRHGTLAELGDFLVARNREGWGVSVTINRTDGEGRQRENIDRARGLFLDFDDGLTQEQALAFMGQELGASAVVRTPRGAHVYWWIVAGHEPDWAMWEAAQRQLAKRHGAEVIADRTKAMRLPGFYHHKGEPALVELDHLVDTHSGLGMLVRQFGIEVGPSRSRRAVKRHQTRAPLSEKQEQYAAWLAEHPPAVQGAMGHKTLVTACMRAGDFGLDADQAWELVQDYNARCSPPWEGRDLYKQLQSALRSRKDDPGVGIQQPRPPEPPPHEDDDAPEGGRPKLILDPERPIEGALRFVELEHSDGGQRTLHRLHRVYWRWQGVRYEQVDDEMIDEELYPFLRHIQRQVGDGEGGKVLKAYGTRRSRITDIERALRSSVALKQDLQTPCWLQPRRDDPRPDELLVCRNGMVHLPTGRFYAPDPRFFSMTSLGVPYNPEAPEPTLWLRFLEQLWEDDRESQQLLQEWFGYCLTPDVSQHKALIMVGPPRSGKGTIANVLTEMLGGPSVTSIMMGDFTSEFGLWRLLGKSLAIVPDARVSGRYDSAQIVEKFLAITGGDLVSVNRKNLAPVDVRLGVRFMLLTNVVPQLADAAAAFPERLLPLALDQSFLGKEDRGLGSRLAAELPGILNWAVAGWHRLRERGSFTRSSTSEHIREALEEASSPCRAFVRQCCDLDPQEFTSTSQLFEAWRTWCQVHGRHSGSSSTFGRNLRAGVPGITVQRTGGANGRTRGYAGISVDHDRLPKPERESFEKQRGFGDYPRN